MAPTCGARPAPISPQLLDELTFALAGAGDAPVAALLGLAPASSGQAELLVRPSGPAGPLADLLGWHAPTVWSAVGVFAPAGVFRGRAGPGRDDGRGESATLALLVDRGGAVASALGDRSGGAWRPGQPEGRLLDACRRALRLPTAPPDRPVRDLWSQRWLDVLLEQLARGEAPDVERAAALHPLAGLVGTVAPDLTALARTALADTTWSELRRLAARRPGLEEMSPVVAAWMDDGMFARWLMDRVPPVDELLVAVEELAPATLWRSVCCVVAAWAATP